MVRRQNNTSTTQADCGIIPGYRLVGVARHRGRVRRHTLETKTPAEAGVLDKIAAWGQGAAGLNTSKAPSCSSVSTYMKPSGPMRMSRTRWPMSFSSRSSRERSLPLSS